MNQEENNSYKETDFVEFYLEQENQKSNVYYASARGATVYYKILPGKVVYKKTRMKIAAALAVFCLLAVSAGMFFIVYRKNARLAEESGISVKNGYEELLSAQKALAEFRFGQSFFDFNSAYQSFNSARTDVSYFSALALNVVQYWPFNFFAETADNAISDIQNELARVGLEAANSAGLFLKAARTGESADLAGALDGMRNAQKGLKDIKEKLEISGDAGFAGVISQLNSIVSRFEYAIPRLELGVWASGIDQPRTFLVVVQNTGQARATGGAITSVGAITIENGRASKIFFDDVYNIDGQLQTKVVPPKPIQKMDTVWNLHNANWFLDFPTSAQKISYFYQKSQGVYPDGVIAVDEKALEKFLEITGPVELLKYDLVVDRDNFSHLTASNILDEKRANQTKRVFNDFTAALFDKLFSMPEDKLGDLFGLIKEGAAQKDMLLWLNDEKRERVVSDARWSGEVPEAPSEDYFAVVATNMNGAGNGAAAEQDISKASEITDRGEIINTVRVERKYNNDGFSEKSPEPEYWRLYAPLGSELISVSGFMPPPNIAPIDYINEEFKTDKDVAFSEKTMRVDTDTGAQIFQESGKTVFGGWAKISSKDPAEVTVKYKLPFLVKAQDKVRFMFQKQPGAESRLNFKVLQPNNPEPIFSYDSDFSTDLFFDAPAK